MTRWCALWFVAFALCAIGATGAVAASEALLADAVEKLDEAAVNDRGLEPPVRSDVHRDRVQRGLPDNGDG